MMTLSKNNKYQKPIGDEAENFIGKHVHLANAPSGCVWILKKIVGDILYLETPKTKKARTAHRSQLRSLSTYDIS